MVRLIIRFAGTVNGKAYSLRASPALFCGKFCIHATARQTYLKPLLDGAQEGSCEGACVGCRGPVEDANSASLIAEFEARGFARQDIAARLRAFAPQGVAS